MNHACDTAKRLYAKTGWVFSSRRAPPLNLLSSPIHSPVKLPSLPGNILPLLVKAFWPNKLLPKKNSINKSNITIKKIILHILKILSKFLK